MGGYWYPYGQMYGHMAYAGGWHIGLHILFWILVVALVVLGIVVLVRLLRTGEPALHRRAGAALAILEERYARGEIQREEYLQKKRDLEGRSEYSAR